MEWKVITFFLHRGSENIFMICPGVSTSDDAGYYGVNTGGICYGFSGGPVPGGKTALQFLPIWYLLKFSCLFTACGFLPDFVLTCMKEVWVGQHDWWRGLILS
jgi:hypothetical protein